MPVAELGPRLQSNPFAAAASLDSRRFALRNSFAAAARQCASASALCLCCHSLHGCSVAPPPASAPAQAPSVLFRPSSPPPLQHGSHICHTLFPPLRLSVGASLVRCLPACLRLSESVTARRPNVSRRRRRCHDSPFCACDLAWNASGATLLCWLGSRPRSASPSSSHPLGLLRASHAHTSILPRISSSLVPAIAQLAHALLRCIRTPTSSSTRSAQSRIHQPALQISVVNR